MSTSALIMMIGSQGLVAVVTAFFFYKVLVTPGKPETDDTSDDGDLERLHEHLVN